MTRMVALLRGINVGGNRKVPMADLRALVEAGGFGDVASYIQSGNVVFTAAADVAAVTVALEKAIAERFGFAVDVIVRTAEAWRPYAGDGPFPEARRDRPNHTMLCLAARPAGSKSSTPWVRGPLASKAAACAFITPPTSSTRPSGSLVAV